VTWAKYNGRFSVSDLASISSGASKRYAKAIFALAKEEKKLESLTADLSSIEDALEVSDDLNQLIFSPVYNRLEQESAILAISDKMGLSGLMKNSLGLLAVKRRLNILPSLIEEVKIYIAEDKGEVTVNVTSASVLSEAQTQDLTKSLEKTIGKEIKIETSIDESLIGGLIVKVGSKMIDSSIRSKLTNLQNIMKEVR
tara:strand:- start:25 stop:618 length:594 start_codon:yes stop_codon:yes gene_type:complete